jgi:hypothetical protein
MTRGITRKSNFRIKRSSLSLSIWSGVVLPCLSCDLTTEGSLLVLPLSRAMSLGRVFRVQGCIFSRDLTVY